jgi:predicted N-acetyltransferase YhbS
MNEITYRYGNDLDVDEVIEFLKASTLGERRPIDDKAIIADMIRHGNLTVTAWDGDLLVGFARTLTDFSYCGYMSDLAVRVSHQQKGIGTELIQKTREKMGPRSGLILLAAPKAVNYYPKIGFTQPDSAWVLRTSDPFPVNKLTPGND